MNTEQLKILVQQVHLALFLQAGNRTGCFVRRDINFRKHTACFKATNKEIPCGILEVLETQCEARTQSADINVQIFLVCSVFQKPLELK